MKNRIELRAYIRFQLTQLGAANGAHAFEQLCFELARRRIAPNLLPATGPVQAGGDHGRDFESYRTYLAGGPIAQSSFLARASDELIVGACTLERNNLPAKVRSDLKSMFGFGPQPEQVIYFCQADMPVATRHKLQAHCRKTYSASLDIHDGQAIADQLSDPDTFWIAEQYLSVPADFFPESPPDEEYAALKAQWLTKRMPVTNYADFLELKRGLRAATQTEAVRPDLSAWIGRLRELSTQPLPTPLLQRTRYEIAVAELRGHGDLDPARDLLDAYFGALDAGARRAVDLLDAATLVVYCWGATRHGATTLDPATVVGWAHEVGRLVEAAQGMTARRGEVCTLLEARAMLACLSRAEEEGDAVLDRMFKAWTEVLEEIEETRHYPAAHIANLVDTFAPFVGDRPVFRLLRDRIDRLMETRAGGHAVAQRSMDRARGHLKAGNRLAAIDELQRAKAGWFSGDEMENSVRAMLLLAQCYNDLNLNYAARYYAAGAAYVAVHNDDDDVRALTPLAALALAMTFFAACESLSFLMAFGQAATIQSSLGREGDESAQTLIRDGLVQTAHFRVAARKLAPQLTPLIEQIVATWPIRKAELDKHLAIAGSEESPWNTMDRAELEALIVGELGVTPFADLGPDLELQWSALGVRWVIRTTDDPPTRAAAQALAAVLQIIQVELADVELLVIPTTADIQLTLGDVARPSIREGRRASDGLAWDIRVPRVEKNDDKGFEDALIMASTVLGQVTALKRESFLAAVETAFKRGLGQRAFSVRPAREMMTFAQEQLGAEGDKLRGLATVPTSRPAVPLEAPELAWPTTPGPGYSPERARKFLENRYRRPYELAAISLPRLLADLGLRPRLQALRDDGVRDWQIISMLMSMVVQHQSVGARPEPTNFGEVYQERLSRPESPDDPELDPASVTEEALENQLVASFGACFQTWGLQLNRQSIDPAAMRRLLDVRYRQATDDIPHDDILKG